MKKYVLAIDQGTTSTCLVVVDKKGNVVYKDSRVIKPIETYSDEVFYSAQDISLSVVFLLRSLFDKTDIKAKEIQSIGITNQRETIVVWNKRTGGVAHPIISWQDTSTKYITDEWLEYEDLVYEKTGLKISPYFSASKIKHILNNTDENINDLLIGTMDSYMLYQLTNGREHKTDVTNASRTMLFNIHTKEWDDELLELFGIPKELLPTVLSNDGDFGYFDYDGEDIPINTLIGDQQASLFGHQCFNVGDTKITYGTGTFILTNIGSSLDVDNNNLIKTIFYDINNETKYALEGSIFSGGSSLGIMNDKFDLFDSVLALGVLDNYEKGDDIYVVPAFTGLGAPYWDEDARGAILGLKKNTETTEILKATINSMAYQVTDVIKEIDHNTNIKINNISVDGGASINNYLMKFQSSLLKRDLIRTRESDMTALGAAYMSGLLSGFWSSKEELKTLNRKEKVFVPTKIDESLYENWKKAVKLVREFK